MSKFLCYNVVTHILREQFHCKVTKLFTVLIVCWPVYTGSMQPAGFDGEEEEEEEEREKDKERKSEQ